MECLVVDDASTDSSAAIAEEFGARLLTTGPRTRGPAAARNLGASCTQGDIVLFLDADVCVRHNTLEQIADEFAADPAMDALMGSYDDTPAETNFCSQYRNLMHCFFHQTGRREASTFWTGCGAIRRHVFLNQDGFDERYFHPSMEDVELGYRLTQNGCRIVLDSRIQVTHAKKWTLLAMLKADVLNRGIPWTRLILRYRMLPDDLNLSWSQRASVPAAWLIAILILFAIFQAAGAADAAYSPWSTALLLASAALFVALNLQFYRFLAQRRGLYFSALAIPLHLCFHFLNGVSFLAGAFLHTRSPALAPWSAGPLVSLEAIPARTESRAPSVTASWIFGAWLIFAFLITLPFLLWEIQYFRHPGPRFYQFELAFAAVFFLCLPLYHRLRQHRVWQWELAGLLSIPLGLAAIYEPRGTLVIAVLTLCTFTLGRALLCKIACLPGQPLDQIVVSIGVGFGMLCPLLLAIGMVRGYYAAVFLALLLLPMLMFRRHLLALPHLLVELHHAWGRSTELRSALGTILVSFAVLFEITASMVVLAPSIVFDVLRYHLPEAQTYASHHGLTVLPFLSNSLWPQNAETLMTLAYSLAGQTAAQMISPLFFLLSIGALAALVRRFGTSMVGTLAAVVLASSIPFLHWAGSVAKNDLQLAFFELTALLAFFIWRETAKFTWLQVSALLIGTAIGTKYTVLYALPPLALLYGFAIWKQPRRLRALSWIVLIVAASALPWQLRAFALTGSPFYPFHLASALYTTSTTQGWQNVLTRFILMPWKVQFLGANFNEGPLQVPLGIAFLLFLPAWFLSRGRRTNNTEKLAIGFAGLYLLYWWPSVPALRYAIVPAILLIASLASRLDYWYKVSSPWLKYGLLAAFCNVLWFSLSGIQITEINGPQLRFFTHQINASQYLSQALTTFPAMDYLKARTGRGTGVLGVTNCSAAYAPDPALFNCTSGETREVAASLGTLPFQYVVLPAGKDSDRVSAPFSNWISGQPLFEDSNFRVYQLRNPAGNPSHPDGAR